MKSFPYFLALIWRCLHLLTPTSVQGVVHLQTPTPTYCIDPQILLITNTRAEKCFTGGSSSHELQYLRKISVANYHRAQELLAFQYFVEYKANPYRRPCANADFEFIHQRLVQLVDIVPKKMSQEMRMLVQYVV